MVDTYKTVNGIGFDFSVFKSVDMMHVSTWSQVEMQCAIHGTEISADMFNAIIVAGSMFRNIYDMLLKCIEKRAKLLRFFDNDMIADALYIAFHVDLSINPILESTAFSILSDMYSHDINIVDSQYMHDIRNFDTYENDKRSATKRMFKMLDVIDRKFPLLFLRFFDRNKLCLFMKDKVFTSWIFKKTEIKAKEHPQKFMKVLTALNNEKKKLQSTSMFVN